MAGTLKEITENYEKLHRLQMIDTMLGAVHLYVKDVVSRLEEDFDDCGVELNILKKEYVFGTYDQANDYLIEMREDN